MSDDSSDQNSNGHSNGEPEGTVLGDNAGVYIPSGDEEGEEVELPADFGSFVVSLGTNCMINLGRIEHPETGQVERDIASAKHTIDILEMLQVKTEGNLDTEEEKLLDSLLYDLRSAFMQEKKAKN